MGGMVSGGRGIKSGYKMEIDDSPPERCSWILGASSDLGALKIENFKPSTATGKGKFGAVFLAMNMKTHKHVAIKYVSYTMIFNGKHADRIDQEIKVVKDLDHPFIVHYYGTFRTPGSIAMVFEFVMGGELYMRMKKLQKMAEIEAKFYACEIAVALDYLHNNVGIIYRDLKPENILLDTHGHIKLCDFGFACPLRTLGSLSDGCGTIVYLAPEIASGYKNASHGYPVDWWSLGCIIYEMVTGDAPFGDTDKDNKFAILNNINGKTLRYPMSMSSELKELLTGLLNKNAGQRSDWSQFSTAAWVAGVDWPSLVHQKIRPPWGPKQSATPDTSNFLSWTDLELPVAPAPRDATQYCLEHIKVDTGPSLRSTCLANSTPDVGRNITPPPSQHVGAGADPNSKAQVEKKKEARKSLEQHPSRQPDPHSDAAGHHAHGSKRPSLDGSTGGAGGATQPKKSSKTKKQGDHR